MTKKLTTEEWNRINSFDFDSMDATKSKEVLSLLLNNPTEQETLYLVRALTNPLTREWAHDKFVEEEEKFLFTKIKEVDGQKLHLNIIDNGDGDNRIYLDSDDPTPLTIQQVEDYGFNLDKFEKIPYEYITVEVKDNPYF